MVMCGGEEGLHLLNLGSVDHLTLDVACLLPTGLETSSPLLPLGWGGNIGHMQWVLHVTWSIDHPHQHWITRLHTKYGLVINPLRHISGYFVLIHMFTFQRKT
jgi:hypothetical protein